MWHEIAGAQIALLFEVQRAWVREIVRIRSGWRSGRLARQMPRIEPARGAPAREILCEHCTQPAPSVANTDARTGGAT